MTAAQLVVDASALAEFLIASDSGTRVGQQLLKHSGRLNLPHLAITEVHSVLRGLVMSGSVAAARAEQAITDLVDFPAVRWPAEPLLPRMWQLRANITSYDANYVALAEALDGRLLTADRRLAAATRRHTDVAVILILAHKHSSDV